MRSCTISKLISPMTARASAAHVALAGSKQSQPVMTSPLADLASQVLTLAAASVSRTASPPAFSTWT